MSKYILHFILLCICTSIISCGEEERTSLNVEERKIVNSRYKEALDSINKLMIAECSERRKKKFDQLVDSLKTTRLEEIQLITKTKSNEE